MPGLSVTPIRLILASSRLKAMPDTTACSILTSSSKVIRVPERASSAMSMSHGVKLDSTRKGTRYLPANSTERICSTFEPRLAISSISSKLIVVRRRASATMRGSVV